MILPPRRHRRSPASRAVSCSSVWPPAARSTDFHVAGPFSSACTQCFSLYEEVMSVVRRTVQMVAHRLLVRQRPQRFSAQRKNEARARVGCFCHGIPPIFILNRTRLFLTRACAANSQLLMEPNHHAPAQSTFAGTGKAHDRQRGHDDDRVADAEIICCISLSASGSPRSSAPVLMGSSWAGRLKRLEPAVVCRRARCNSFPVVHGDVKRDDRENRLGQRQQMRRRSAVLEQPWMLRPRAAPPDGGLAECDEHDVVDRDAARISAECACDQG